MRIPTSKAGDIAKRFIGKDIIPILIEEGSLNELETDRVALDDDGLYLVNANLRFQPEAMLAQNYNPREDSHTKIKFDSYLLKKRELFGLSWD